MAQVPPLLAAFDFARVATSVPLVVARYVDNAGIVRAGTPVPTLLGRQHYPVRSGRIGGGAAEADAD